MAHEDIKTTMIYGDYMPAAREVDLIEQAMKRVRLGSTFGSVLSETTEN